jgi:TRAP-type C4-dicarboxylate transport system permease small subunit
MLSNKKTGIIAGLFGALAPRFTLAAYDAESTGLNDTAKQAGLSTNPDQLPVVIGTIIRAALSLIGVVFLLLMVYAGYLWMIARGDEGKVERAKDTITRAIIGLVIVLGAYALTNFVINAFTQSPETNAPTTTETTS